MLQAIKGFFNSDSFMPHGHCFLWQSDIFWLHVISDSTIALAYFAIPFVLIYLLVKRKDIPFENIFLLFAAFILFCGLTHIMSIWLLWNPDYAAAGVLKALTALASVGTFFVLVKLVPRILSIPNTAQIAIANQQLEKAHHELEVLYQQNRVRSESYLQAVMDTVLDGLISIDEKGTIQSFNASATRIFGYQPEEVIGKNVNMLMPEPYHAGHDGYLKNYLTTGEKKVIGIGREVSGKRKDESVFPMELGINEMRLDGARMFVGTVRDISVRKEMEAEKLLLRSVMNAVSTSSTIEEAIQQTLQEVCVSISWKIGHAYRWDESQQAMVSSKLWYFADDESLYTTFRQVSEEMSFRSGVGLKLAHCLC